MKPTPAGWPRFSSSIVYQDAAAAIDWLCSAFDFEVRIKVEGENGRERPPHLLQPLLESFRLGGGPGEAVEDEPVRGAERLDHHLHHHVVGDELAGVHVLLRQPAELGAVPNVVAEQVPGPDQLDPVALAEPPGLRALPRPRRAKEHDPHYRRNPS